MARKSKISTIEAPPVDDPKRAEYTPPEAKDRRLTMRGQNPNEAERKDHVYGIASRDRWAEGNVTQQHRESMSLDGTVTNGGEGEDSGETIEPAKMKKAELQEALREAGVAFETDDNKDRLVQLYSDWLADNQ